jgi:dipeptidyl aminopeptidase/acylaminoacyl peptidase
VSTFIEPEIIHYPSFDGLQIPALWYLPHDAQPNHQTPVVVSVHGGPEGQAQYTWNATFQYFLRRGYAVLAPNVRGSSGYGKHYLSLDDVRQRPDSITDLKYAVDWLYGQPTVAPKKIAVMGGSYGGFMVLAALTTFPDLWAAGVDIVGIANLLTFLENTSSYRRHLRTAEYGDPERDRDFLIALSPIHKADRIQAPLMVIHGAQDPRVPVGEAEQIVEHLRAGQRPVEYQRFEDEGHGIVKLKNRLVCYPRIASFLDTYLLSDG